MKKICVFGLGYIGLPTACLLATHGHRVTGIDVNKKVVDLIGRGEVIYKEPGLKGLLKKALTSGNLVAKTEPEAADIFLIAVPTPLDKEANTADLRYVREATASIAQVLKEGNLVILESTVPPGTCERVLLPILESSGLKRGKNFHLAHCPERAIPGNAIHEMVNNDRIIGSGDEQSATMTKELYSAFVKGSFYFTDLRTAEVVKLMENAYRDINIALVNEFAKIAEENRINIWEAIELANRHPRVSLLKPGPGVGGHCLVKDPWFLNENSSRSRIISLAREINDSMPGHVLGLVKELTEGTRNATITVLGVAYKADVDDTRETPALRFVRLAENSGCKVKIHDPWVKHFDYPLYTLEEAVRDSDCLVLITDHTQFRQIDPVKLSALMRHRNLVDARNVLDAPKWAEAGFRLRVLGKGTAAAG